MPTPLAGQRFDTDGAATGSAGCSPTNSHGDNRIRRFPLAPQRIVADTRAALGRSDIVLVDTGAVKMWMARLYPTYERNTCLISNGLSTMAFALPGAIGVKLAKPDCEGAGGDRRRRVPDELPGDRDRGAGADTAGGADLGGRRLRADRVEDGPGTRRAHYVAFTNPDVVAYAESFGAKGYRITSADELLPTLKAALDDDGVSLIACPVDYSENLRLTDTLGHLDETL